MLDNIKKIIFCFIRYNLDPENQITDDDAIWKALEIAQLKSAIMELPEKLGSNNNFVRLTQNVTTAN